MFCFYCFGKYYTDWSEPFNLQNGMLSGRHIRTFGEGPALSDKLKSGIMTSIIVISCNEAFVTGQHIGLLQAKSP